MTKIGKVLADGGHIWHNSPRSSGTQAAGEETEMPLFMDVHSMSEAVSAADVAQAHQADLKTQEQYGVEYKRYWVDEKGAKIFCLVEAPDAEAANTVHREAHGLVADEIYQVSEHS